MSNSPTKIGDGAACGLAEAWPRLRMSWLGVFSGKLVFDGRASRSEFWWGAIATILVFLIIFAGTRWTLQILINCYDFTPPLWLANVIALAAWLVLAPLVISSWAQFSRRLHDINLSYNWGMPLFFSDGIAIFCWPILAVLDFFWTNNFSECLSNPPAIENLKQLFAFPCIYAIPASILFRIFYIFLCSRDSTHGSNRFGPSAKYPD